MDVMDVINLSLAVGLPWFVGVVWLRYQWREAPEGAWAMVLGYGYVAGILFTTLIMRGLDLFGLQLGFLPITLILSGFAFLGLQLTRDIPWRGWAGGWTTTAWLAQVRWKKGAFIFLMMVLAVRTIDLGLELIWNPLFAWDAWATWAPKARVWYELRRLIPFVDWGAWVAQDPFEAYTIAAYHYPPTAPLIEVWTTMALGRWDDSLMNLPWLVCGVALGLGFYGQARIWGVGPLTSLVFTYFLLSLPLLNTHVALAGNADLWLATVYGMAAMAFFHWLRRRERRQGLLALGLAIACTQIKVPGLVWMLTFLPALVIPRLPTRLVLAGAGVFLAAVATWILWGGPGQVDLPYLGSYAVGPQPGVWGAFYESYAVLATWHLFWYLWVAVALLNLRRWVDDKVFLSMGVLVLAGFSFVGAVYFLTPLGEFAVDFTQLNRATLHMVPMLAFVALALFASSQVTPADAS